MRPLEQETMTDVETWADVEEFDGPTSGPRALQASSMQSPVASRGD